MGQPKRFAMSRIVRFHEFGEADVLKIEERTAPAPAAGEVLIDVEAVGDRVASFPGHSANRYPSYAEHVVLPRSSLARYPANLTAQQAAVHYLPSMVGWFGFNELARLQPGETVLVTAASRCWGPYIVQMGKALGATVIAATAFAEDSDLRRLP